MKKLINKVKKEDNFNKNYTLNLKNVNNYRELLFYYNKENKYKDSSLFYSNNNYNYQNDFFAQNKITYNLNTQNNIKLNFVKDSINLFKFFTNKNTQLIFNNLFDNKKLNIIFKDYINLFTKNQFSLTDQDFVLNFNNFCLFLNNLKTKIINGELDKSEIEAIKKQYNRKYYKLIVIHKNLNQINLEKSSESIIDDSTIIFLFRFLRNNIVGMITSSSGNVISSISSGRLGYKGKKKISVLAAKDIAN